ncbi:kremen protein 1-like [Branchiostoma lanceolatum]|uniref:kremen protein 1-like n=1 Tax=Branchiostoma lanceolatum TaxID=7740 RepID=UPI003452506C
MKPGVVLTATYGALCVVILTSLPASAQDPGCQKIRISGSTSLQTHLMTTYTITDEFLESRPVYNSDTTDDTIYYVSNPYPKNAPTWFVGPYPEPGENGLNVEDSSLYANNIEGTFNIWDPETREWKDAPYVEIGCADPGYIGCFSVAHIDDFFRIPLGQFITVESCIETCRNYPGKSIAAVSMQGCICGSGVNHDSHAPFLCTIPCGGNSDQTCGGLERADVYQTWVGVCGYRKQTGAIYSPRYPGTYPPYNNCTWEINFDPDKVIKFYYNVWDVPAGDTLVITDKSGQSRTLGPGFDTAWTNEATVNFLLDSSRNGKFAIQYEAVDHCGGIGTTGGVAQISPSHGGNFAVGQQVTIRCTDGTETVVECLQDKVFNVTEPYCAGSPEGVTTVNTGTAAAGDQAKGTSAPTVVIVVVSVVAVLILLAVLCVVVYFVIKKRATKESGTTNHEYDMVDPGTSNDEYEVIDTQDSRPPARSTQQDSRPPARSPKAPATVPPPPGVFGTHSDSDYPSLDPRTMCNTDSEYTSLTTNQTSVGDSDYENDPEYQNTFGKIYQNA